MPPKKKKGKGKGKKKKKDDASLELEDKYKKTMTEIEALKDHLAIRKEIARKSQSVGNMMKSRMAEAQKDMEEQKADQKAINSEMALAYKSMQTTLQLKVHTLDMKLMQTEAKLKETEKKLRETEDEKERITREKDEEIEKLNLNIRVMEKEYIRILDESLNSLVAKIDGAKSKWELSGSNLQARSKQNLLELGLHPLDI
ncbi:coiled-coil domain-containing protein 153-like [Pecten maximus]|uniref:coiled-coil domain-containing protein 153-like n=1 Tax=Pecten maximus TaxID=6579 RepID=UPI0014587667|nr:coiled-coil domain-containing protein 153-like [Pecten maximus]